MLGWLAVIALLFPTLLALLPPSTASSAVPAWALASLCHIETAASPAAAGSGAPPAPASKAPFCPICIAVQLAGTLLLPGSVAVRAPALSGIVTAPVAEATLAAASYARAPSARAPPLAC